MLFAALFLCRFLIPTEATEQGYTLWLAALGFGFAAVTIGSYWHRSEPIRFRLTLVDYSVAAMVLGHLLSGFIILTGQGNRRSALNIMWEWAAIGIFWVLCRLILKRRDSKRIIVSALVIAVTSLSLLGIWQHYFWFPQQAQRFDKLIHYMQRVEAHDSLAVYEQQEYKLLMAELGTDLASLDAAGRMSFLSRVQDSVEPIGRFALANSFAAPLIIAFLLVFYEQIIALKGQDRRRQAGLAAIVMVVLLCLFLTKSRTAWVGTAVGLLVMFVSGWRNSQGQVGLPRWAVPVFILVIILMIGWTTLTGGLDPQVISEAPKSLQYRLEYWTSTSRMLGEHFVFGVGPGNFRQHYLGYKLPGASEEVLDPHNLFLGIWASGGLLALIGLLAFIGAVLSQSVSVTQTGQQTVDVKSPLKLSSLLIPQLLTFICVIGVLNVIEGTTDPILFYLAGVAILVSVLFSYCSCRVTVSPIGLLAAFVAILIHLLGASGIEMPAIMMLLLLLAALILPASPDDSKQEKTLPLSGQFGVVCLCVMTMLGSVAYGLVPVRLAQTEINLGKYHVIVEGRTQIGRQSFQRAADADPLSPEPQQQLALLNYSLWEKSGKRDDRLFDKAVNHLHEAIDLDPFAAGRYRRLGYIWNQRFAISQNSEHAANAIVAYKQAVALYPNFASLQAEYALALKNTQEDAAPVAKFALSLDDLNHKNGHDDKQLSDELRKQLEEIVD